MTLQCSLIIDEIAARLDTILALTVVHKNEAWRDADSTPPFAIIRRTADRTKKTGLNATELDREVDVSIVCENDTDVDQICYDLRRAFRQNAAPFFTVHGQKITMGDIRFAYPEAGSEAFEIQTTITTPFTEKYEA